MTDVAIVFAINVLTSIVKRWVWPKYGVQGVQAVVFVLALVGAAYTTYSAGFPALRDIVMQALMLFAGAVALYEVILQHIPAFKDFGAVLE